MGDKYEQEYRRSLEEPEAFWLEAAQAISWTDQPKHARHLGGWFHGGRLNSCFNAVDRHVEQGHGDKLALIYDSPVTGAVRQFSYAELQQEVARVAGMIAAASVGRGDRVIIYMPMVPEAVFAMLACARIGAVHSVVFGGFAAAELAKRIDDAEPKLILTASCGIEPGRIVAYKPLLDEAIALAQFDVRRCIVLQREQVRAELLAGRDEDWEAALASAEPAGCVPVAAEDPLYILYTSGTTGIPKGVVRDNGGHAVAIAWSMRNVYGATPNDTFWAASDIGWVVGHSYIVYGPLLLGCTTILYEGKPVGTPDASAFWRVVNDHQVSLLFTAPTAIRAIRREDPEAFHLHRLGTGRLRALFLAGERADPESLGWAAEQLKLPVIDHWWQTELGWPAIATCLGLGRSEIEAGSAGHPVPSFGIDILDGSHQPLPAEEIGEIAIRLPLPPGCLTTLWNNDSGYHSAYLQRHPGYYTAGDAGLVDRNGRIHVMSRIDDIINVAGHRLSTGALEQVIARHPAVAECAVVGAADAVKGMVPIACVVTRPDADRTQPELQAELVQLVRQEIGPIAAMRTVALLDKLPKTRSGKILRSAIRTIADGGSAGAATIEDPDSLIAVREALLRAGHLKRADEVMIGNP